MIRTFGGYERSRQGYLYVDTDGKLKATEGFDYWRHRNRAATPVKNRAATPVKEATLEAWKEKNKVPDRQWMKTWETHQWPTSEEIQKAIRKRESNPGYRLKPKVRKEYLKKVMSDPTTLSVAVTGKAWICKVCGVVYGSDPQNRPRSRQFGHRWTSLHRTRGRDLEKLYLLQQSGCLHKEE
jgi:hypothetical protein